MDIFNKEKIAILEAEILGYRSRNAQLEQYKNRAEDAELRVKCMKMYVDDDEAIDELLSAVKKTEDADRCLLGYGQAQLHAIAMQSAQQGQVLIMD